MRPTGLGHGVYKGVPDYGVFCGEFVLASHPCGWCLLRGYASTVP